MEIRTNCKNDEALRKSLSLLANKEFGIDLESWYENGFWQNDYIPYCAVEDGNVIANVSVNICNFKIRSQIRHLAQIGTVVTAPEYRMKGYSTLLMNRALSECVQSFEGVYLYCEEKTVPFYERFGFKRTDEYICSKKVDITNKATAENIPMNTKEDWGRMVDIIQRRKQYGERIMVNNTGLFMFYLAGPFSQNVYYVPSSEAYVVAAAEGDTLTLYAAFAEEKISLGDIITSFGSSIRNVSMAFMPENNTGFDRRKKEDEGSVLMTKGSFFENAANERFMFPEISYA